MHIAILIWVACVFCLGLVPIQAHASCETPSYVDRYGVVDRSNVAQGGVNRCKAPNTQKPLFTRQGTISCATKEGYDQAYEIRIHDWVLAPLLGVTFHGDRSTLAPDGRATPTFFGCTVNPDGVAVTLLAGSAMGAIHTNLGWLSMDDLRNSREDTDADDAANKTAQRASYRPTLCKSIDDCVYTDVTPYQPVPRVSVDSRFYRTSSESIKGHEREVSSAPLQSTQFENLQFVCTYQNGLVKTMSSSCPNQDFSSGGGVVHSSQLVGVQKTGQSICTYDFYVPRQLVSPYGGGTSPAHIQFRTTNCPQTVYFVVDKTGTVTVPTAHASKLLQQSIGINCTYHVPDLNIDFDAGSSVGRQCPDSVAFGVVPRPAN
ncbi:MAG: hypothetical protein ACLQEI_18295 [Terriglobales bacterium]